MPSAALAPRISSDVPEILPRKRFTRGEVAVMLEAGIFAGQRVELIGGELIDKMGQNPPHATTIRRMTKFLAGIFGLDRVLVQAPIQVSGPDSQTSEPEPDLAVLSDFVADELESRHPNASELVLAVEVSDTTARFDATRKRDIYARAGLREYWVLDLNAETLLIHRKPTPEGQYAETRLYTRNQSVSVAGSKLALSKMLPPQQRA